MRRHYSKVNETSPKNFEFLMQLFSWHLDNTDILDASKILAHRSTADPNGLNVVNNVDNIAMTNSWAPLFISFIWEDVIASNRLSLLTTKSREKRLLILLTGNKFVLSVSIFFSCLSDLQDSMTSGCTMISRRWVMMVFSTKNRDAIISLKLLQEWLHNTSNITEEV